MYVIGRVYTTEALLSRFSFGQMIYENYNMDGPVLKLALAHRLPSASTPAENIHSKIDYSIQYDGDLLNHEVLHIYIL